jgi:hypothetical protein
MGEKESFLRWLSHTQEIRQKGGGAIIRLGQTTVALQLHTSHLMVVFTFLLVAVHHPLPTQRPLTVRVMSSWLSLARTIGRGSASKNIFSGDFIRRRPFLRLPTASPKTNNKETAVFLSAPKRYKRTASNHRHIVTSHFNQTESSSVTSCWRLV